MRAYAKTTLAHTGVKLPVVTVFVVESGQLGGAHHVEPIGIALIRLIAHVEHGVTADSDGALTECVHLKRRLSLALIGNWPIFYCRCHVLRLHRTRSSWLGRSAGRSGRCDNAGRRVCWRLGW